MTFFTLAFRRLRHYPSRSFLMCFGVAISVFLILASSLIGRSVEQFVEDVTAAATDGFSLVVSQPPSVESSDREGIARSQLALVQRIEGIDRAVGVTHAQVSLTRDQSDDGKLTFSAFSLSTRDYGNFFFQTGASPKTGEIALDAVSASELGWAPGEIVDLGSRDRSYPLRISGEFTLAGAPSAPLRWALISEEDGARVLRGDGKFDLLLVAATATPAERRRISGELPADLLVQPLHVFRDSLTQEVEPLIDGLRAAFLVFGGVASIGACLMVFNMFCLIAVQRRPEHELLRSIGASRGHILTTDFLEAGMLGLIGAGMGCLLALIAAQSLPDLLSSFGARLPALDVRFSGVDVAVAVVVGVASVGVGALAPSMFLTRSLSHTRGDALPGRHASLPPSVPIFGVIGTLLIVLPLALPARLAGVLVLCVAFMLSLPRLINRACAEIARLLIRRGGSALALHRLRSDLARTTIMAVGLMVPVAVVTLGNIASSSTSRGPSSGAGETFLTFINLLVTVVLVVAIVGSANSLALAALVRRQEIVLLHKIGATVAQIRFHLVAEILWTAAIGLVLGILLGLGLAAYFILYVSGGSGLSVPILRIGILVAGCLLGCLLASSLPVARQTARGVTDEGIELG